MEIEEEGFRCIEVEGTPYEMGYQHGEQCKELIAEALEWAKTDGGATEICEMMRGMGIQLNLTEMRQSLIAGNEKNPTISKMV